MRESLDEVVKNIPSYIRDEAQLLDVITDLLAVTREFVDVEELSDDPLIQESLSAEMMASPESVIINMARYIVVLKEREKSNESSL